MAVMCVAHKKSLKNTYSCKVEAQHYSLPVSGAFYDIKQEVLLYEHRKTRPSLENFLVKCVDS